MNLLSLGLFNPPASHFVFELIAIIQLAAGSSIENNVMVPWRLVLEFFSNLLIHAHQNPKSNNNYNNTNTNNNNDVFFVF